MAVSSLLSKRCLQRLFFKRKAKPGSPLALLCFLLSVGGPAQSATLPTVASINLCTDQLVLLLAEPHQVLSVSELSHQSAGSFLYEKARQFPANTGSSEHILTLAPDVVVAGQFTTKATISLLRELGLQVEILPIANSLADLYANIRSVAGWLGQHEKGEAMVLELKQRVASLLNQNNAEPFTHSEAARPGSFIAAYYDPNGYTVGPNTLRGQVLALAGWENAAEHFGIQHYGSMSLESLVRVSPDAVIDSPYSLGTYSRGQQLLQHPALRASGLNPMVIRIPSRQTTCAGPWTVDMIEYLVSKRAELAAKN